MTQGTCGNCHQPTRDSLGYCQRNKQCKALGMRVRRQREKTRIKALEQLVKAYEEKEKTE